MAKRQKTKRIRKDRNITTEENNVKSFLISVIVILGALGIIYLFTILAKNNGLFDEGYNKPELTTPSISYENITGGTVFDRDEDEYYVLLVNTKSHEYINLSSIVSSYEDNDEHLPVYIVDLNNSFNKYIVSEEDNESAQVSDELKVKEYALIKIDNNKNVKYLNNVEDIENELD